MTEHWYRPDGSGPISVGQFIAEGHTFGWEHNIARSDLTVEGIEVLVSTIFLGLDYSLGRDGAERQIYETMVFGGTFDRSQRRYPSREAALAGHEELVSIVLLDETFSEREAPTS